MQAGGCIQKSSSRLSISQKSYSAASQPNSPPLSPVTFVHDENSNFNRDLCIKTKEGLAVVGKSGLVRIKLLGPQNIQSCTPNKDFVSECEECKKLSTQSIEENEVALFP